MPRRELEIRVVGEPDPERVAEAIIWLALRGLDTPPAPTEGAPAPEAPAEGTRPPIIGE